MILSKIDHVAIIASDLDKSLDFYTKILGFTEMSRIERKERESTIVYLDAGNFKVELFSFPDTPKRMSYPEATGLRHIAFAVKNFDAIVKSLHERGIIFEGERIDPTSQKRVVFFMDPDDLPIEIVEA